MQYLVSSQLLQASSLEFLCQHNFDFNKVLKDKI